MLYVLAIAIHVVVAVVAMGLVGAVPLTARIARLSTGFADGAAEILGELLGATQLGFGLMVLTGVLLDISAGGAFHRTGWFQASIGLLIINATAHARARRSLRTEVVSGDSRARAFRSIERWGWTMVAVVVLVTVLMQSKPL